MLSARNYVSDSAGISFLKRMATAPLAGGVFVDFLNPVSFFLFDLNRIMAVSTVDVVAFFL